MKQSSLIKIMCLLGTLTLGSMAIVSVAAAANNSLNVYVVNYPLKYFAERIGGGHVSVTLPVPPNVDPAYWTPRIAEIGAFQQADLILLNGAGYAKWVPKVSLPRSKTVDTTRNVKSRLITVKEVTTHSHGAAGQHAHEGLAFTTWLDLGLAIGQAQAVTNAFIRKRPNLKATFEAGYASLEKDLLQLDRRIQAIVSRNPDTPLVFSHPVYDYLTQRYGLNNRVVHWEPDEVPTAAQLQELSHILSKHPARWMLWEGEPVSAAVEKLVALGVRSTVFNPCGNVPEKGDFLTVMRMNIANLESVFR